MDWGHSITEAIATTVPIILYIWNNKRKAKKDTERRHEENQAVLNGLVTERRYFPAHGHSEKSGLLQAEGINYPPKEAK